MKLKLKEKERRRRKRRERERKRKKETIMKNKRKIPIVSSAVVHVRPIDCLFHGFSFHAKDVFTDSFKVFECYVFAREWAFRGRASLEITEFCVVMLKE